MTPEQIKLARHALGLPNNNSRSYRNHYVTDAPSDDHAAWSAMVQRGWARCRAGSELTGGGDLFWLTLAGAEQALQGNETLHFGGFEADEMPKIKGAP